MRILLTRTREMIKHALHVRVTEPVIREHDYVFFFFFLSYEQLHCDAFIQSYYYPETWRRKETRFHSRVIHYISSLQRRARFWRVSWRQMSGMLSVQESVCWCLMRPSPRTRPGKCTCSSIKESPGERKLSLHRSVQLFPFLFFLFSFIFFSYLTTRRYILMFLIWCTLYRICFCVVLLCMCSGSVQGNAVL